jgi:hypothetical protein
MRQILWLMYPSFPVLAPANDGCHGEVVTRITGLFDAACLESNTAWFDVTDVFFSAMAKT